MIDTNALHIRIVEFMGLNSGFAREPSLLYRPELVGPGGVRNISDFMAEGKYSKKGYAVRVAKDWAEVIGCPVVDAREEVVNKPEFVVTYLELEDGV